MAVVARPCGGVSVNYPQNPKKFRGWFRGWSGQFKATKPQNSFVDGFVDMDRGMTDRPGLTLNEKS
jgi:hypothetical protein